MRVVVALGGNAILARGARGSAAEQRATIAAACDRLADLIVGGHELVLTHGNGPQVGRMLVQQRAAESEVAGMPLDVLDAQTQGQLGYLLAQQLRNVLRSRDLGRPVAAVVTQVVVDPDDPAFGDPDKPVGPHYTETELEFRAQRLRGAVEGPALSLAELDRATIDDERYGRDSRGTWRRVVASPLPLDIVEAPVVHQLLAAGVVPICAGGGGCPVVRGADGALSGVEAVIDKDRTSALLARLVGADALLVLTDVEQVLLDYGLATQRPVARMTASEARAHLDEGQFPPGSMGPKVLAAVEVAEHGGKAVITSLDRAVDGLAGEAGTAVVPG